MDRKPNTTRVGLNWHEHVIKLVWEKGIEIPNYPRDTWRLDYCGGVMHFPDFGNRNNQYGWEIDHINPVTNGGNDLLTNLQPLSWKMNDKKGNRLDFRCLI